MIFLQVAITTYYYVSSNFDLLIHNYILIDLVITRHFLTITTIVITTLLNS